jgi:hypothetical protein
MRCHKKILLLLLYKSHVEELFSRTSETISCIILFQVRIHLQVEHSKCERL